MFAVSLVNQDLCLKLGIVVFRSIPHLVSWTLMLHHVLSLILGIFDDYLLLFWSVRRILLVPSLPSFSILRREWIRIVSTPGAIWDIAIFVGVIGVTMAVMPMVVVVPGESHVLGPRAGQTHISLNPVIFMQGIND